MFTKITSNHRWLWTVMATFLFVAVTHTAQASGLDDQVPMSKKSWKDVSNYMKDLNKNYSPSPKIRFNSSKPQLIISEKTAVNVLDSVRDSLEEGGKNFEPWVFDFINMSCGLPCDGT